MSTANFPLRRHFTGAQVCLFEHFATGYATYARALLLFFRKARIPQTSGILLPRLKTRPPKTPLTDVMS
jgi:hypothetical protein